MAWLVDDDAQAKRQRTEHEVANRERVASGQAPRAAPAPIALRDGTAAHIVAVVPGCLSAAVDGNGIRPDNPASRLALAKRDRNRDAQRAPGDDDEPVKALTRADLAAFLLVVQASWRVFFRLLAATGLRVSEAPGARRRPPGDGSNPHVKVRRAVGKDGRTYGCARAATGAATCRCRPLW